MEYKVKLLDFILGTYVGSVMDTAHQLRIVYVNRSGTIASILNSDRVTLCIEVTQLQYQKIIATLSGSIIHRSFNGHYYVKLGDMNRRDDLQQIIDHY